MRITHRIMLLKLRQLKFFCLQIPMRHDDLAYQNIYERFDFHRTHRKIDKPFRFKFRNSGDVFILF